jgi:hypothetical protein
VNRVYQWLWKRARLHRSETSGRGDGRIVRTEVTVEQQGVTLLVGGAATGFDACPLCGQKLDRATAELVRLSLQEGSTGQTDFPVAPLGGNGAGGQDDV